jgi:SAM-dependent methyltransferase
MLKTIVRDYQIVAPMPTNVGRFNGNSAATKEIVQYVFADNSAPHTVLDIGFGVGELARLIKTSPATAHWHLDGVDGFEQTCQNAELFAKGWYRNIWHGLAQDIPADALASYDLICLFDVIEHLDAGAARQLLSSLLGALGPRARLALSTPLWFYPQHQNHAGDLEAHLIGVPARALLALQPKMYQVTPQVLIGNFVFGRESLAFIDQFQPTTDRGFGMRQGLEHMAMLGMKADSVLYRSADALVATPHTATPAEAALLS